MSRFLSHLTKHDGEAHYCRYCLHRFCRADLLSEHTVLCKNHVAQRIKMPDAENDILSFNNYQFQLKAPFRIYVDFECFLPKIEGCSPDPNTSSSTATHKHMPSGFCYLVVSDVEKYCKPSIVYRGPDVMKHFIKCVMKENEEIQKILSTPAKIIYTQQDKQDYQATHTHWAQIVLETTAISWENLGPPFKIAAISYINCIRKSRSYSTMEKIMTPI